MCSSDLAEGLAAAHAAGIVHRDLKPDNIRLAKDGRVKLLDFGIARDARSIADSDATRTAESTDPGKVVGTVSYMSPEQVRGGPVDHRSDIFSFGILLYELVAGTRPFQHASSTETMAAILRADTPELPAQSPPALARVIAHALEKDPDKRFQSTMDMAFALRNVTLSGTGIAAAPAPTGFTRRDWMLKGTVAAAAIAVGGAGYWIGRKSASSNPPVFKKVPTGSDTKVFGARFAADGETVIYTVGKPDGSSDLAVVGRRDQLPRYLNVPDLSRLFAVSTSDELAVLLRGQVLARMPLSGGGPRKLMQHVVDADWMPDGNSLAIIRRGSGGKTVVEYPIGKIIAEFPNATAIRVSPDGRRVVVAHFDGIAYAQLTVFDTQNQRTDVAGFKAPTLNAVPCWAPAGNEIWMSSLVAAERTIYAFDLNKNRRPVFTMAGAFELESISRHGTALIDLIDQRLGVAGVAPGDTAERDLSLTDEYAYYSPLAADGKTYAYTIFGVDGPATYLRRITEPHAVRLCDGVVSGPISPDLRWVPVDRTKPRRATFLTPTGLGTESELMVPGLTAPQVVGWIPNGELVIAGRSDARSQLVVWDPSAKKSRVVAAGPFDDTGFCDPEGHICMYKPEGANWKLSSLDGSQQSEVRGVDPNEVVLGFTAGAKELYVTPGDVRQFSTVWRVDWATGKREVWKQFSSPHGRQLNLEAMAIAPDGRSYVYSYEDYRSGLYTADGLK